MPEPGYRRNDAGSLPGGCNHEQTYNFSMPQGSKIVAAIFVCFGLTFAAFGLFAAGISLKNPGSAHGNPLIGIAVCSIFIVIGLGIVFVGVYGARKAKQLAARKQASPDSPWLWRDDWAASRAESKNRNTAIGLWIAALFWNVISITVAAFVVPPLLQKSDLLVLLPLGFCLIGAILFVAAARASIRRERFGKTYFELASLPFVPGRQLRGMIHLRFNTTAAHGIDLKLSCVRQIVIQSGKDSTTNQILLWQDARNIPAGSLNAGLMGDAAIPVDLGIPSDAFETNHDRPNDQVLWLLHAEADVPGVNYSDDFEVPVFRLSPAAVPGTSRTSFASDNSSNNFASSSSAAATAPAFESDASDVARPDNPTVVVSTGPNGGTEFYFHAFRNPSRVMLLILFTTLWTGIVYFLHRSSAPWFFPALFGLFDLLLIHASLQSVLGTVHIEVGNEKIVTRKTLLGLGNAQEIPFSGIAQILAVTGPEQGTMTTNASYSIRVVTKAGKKLNLVNAIYDRQEVRWIVAQMEKLAGLKLDTHVAIDAPFISYAGYGAPPQRGQAPPLPTPASRRGSRTAAVIGGVMFAAWSSFIVFHIFSTPHTTPHRTAPSGTTSTRLHSVTYSALTDRDELRLQQLLPQAQAEELLERAIQHDPRALDLFEQNIGAWLGDIKLTPGMKQLEQRSQFSTDLRVRQANADLNLAMDGWVKNEHSADLMIERAESEPQSRATYVYFMGMLAGRGVAYDRIYPVLVNYAKNDRDATVRQWAVEGMRFLGTDEALDQLFESFTTDRSDLVRERAGCNISDCGLFTRKQRMRMVPRFLSLLNDSQTSPRMRNWSFMALNEITDENLPPNASAWTDWYSQHGTGKMAQFEQQDSWRVRGDE
jgi:HEAT repeats